MYKFHVGIKSVVEVKGPEIIKSKVLVNMLADYGAYDEYPTTKIVLKEIVGQGYCQRIFDKFNNGSANGIVDFDAEKKEFQKKTKYKEDIVSYVFDSLLFGLGVITSIEEPYSNGFDPYESESSDILEKLPSILEKLKKEYTKSLESLLIKPKDLIWDAPAYFSASSENKLFAIEGKIIVICSYLKRSELSWCKKQKNQLLSSYLTRKTNAVRELLDSKKNEYVKLIKKASKSPAIGESGESICFDKNELKNIKELEQNIISLYKELNSQYDNWCQAQKSSLISSALEEEKKLYLSIINNSLVVPSSKFISRSAYFKQTRVEEIQAHENLIRGMYLEKGEKYDNWCENEKDALLSPHRVSTARQIRQAGFKIVLPLAIASISGQQITSYESSVESIQKYEQVINSGDKFLNASNYGRAISYYLAAGDNYAGSFHTYSYKKDAVSKANKTYAEMQSAIEQEFYDKRYKTIFDELNSIPNNYLIVNPESKEWIETTKQKLIEAVDSEVDNLAEFISENDGKLGEEGMKKVDELLSISPDNYWLRLLKTKQ